MRRRRDAVPLQRIRGLDALRGLLIILMVLYHFAFDLMSFGFIPVEYVENGVMRAYTVIVAGLFIALSGLCSRLTSSNLRRGLITAAAAILVTLVTYLAGEPVWFGILHLLGSAMLIYALVGRYLERLPRWTWLVWLALWGATLPLIFHTIDTPGLWIIGLRSHDFFTADYFPLVPWLFLFFSGAGLGGYIAEGHIPRILSETKAPALEAPGRHSLIIYLLHQPLLYGAVYAVYMLKK